MDFCCKIVSVPQMKHDEQNENHKGGNFRLTGSPDPQGRPGGTDLCTAGQCELSVYVSVRFCAHTAPRTRSAQLRTAV